VGSSSFPRYSINRNNGLGLSQGEHTPHLASQAADDGADRGVTAGGPNVTALNTVHFSGKHPSRLVLPVVPLSALPEYKVQELLSAMSKASGKYLDPYGVTFDLVLLLLDKLIHSVKHRIAAAISFSWPHDDPRITPGGY
jgi:hypothetical protein